MFEIFGANVNRVATNNSIMIDFYRWGTNQKEINRGNEKLDLKDVEIWIKRNKSNEITKMYILSKTEPMIIRKEHCQIRIVLRNGKIIEEHEEIKLLGGVKIIIYRTISGHIKVMEILY